MYPYSHLPKPLPPAQYYILLALTIESPHAYPLKASVQNNSLGSVKVSAAKLYPLLQAMHDEGLVDMLGEKPSGKSGKLRMHYGIAEHDKIRLQEESQRLEHATKIARRVGALYNQVPTDIQRMLKSLS